MELKMADGGHTFVKKTFHKPTYCHHCSDLVWGIIQQGYICEVCNFVIHERCVTSVVTPCSGIAPFIIKNPVAHCWSEPTQHKRKFCTVCRKRLDETPAVHCLVCEYFAHIECQDFAVPDCTENATYVPGKELSNVKQHHHWREGNLPATSKCAYCKKTCWSTECLTGYRCEWCGMTTHGGCRMYLPTECNFGVLQPIYLPPHSVSIPRTEVPIEALIGVQVKSKTTLVRDYSCPELSAIDYLENATETANSTTTTTTDTATATTTTATTTTATTTSALHNTRELSLREILLIERQRRERSKRNFLLSSSPPTSIAPSISPLSKTPSPTPCSEVEDINTTTTTGVTTSPPAAVDAPSTTSEFLHHERKGAMIGLQKSPSTPSSICSNILRRMQRARGRHQTSNTDTDDVSAGGVSDEYDHCDVELKRRRETKRTAGINVVRFNPAKVESRERRPPSFCETSDTGGEATTADDIDIDSSANRFSNVSDNTGSSNSSVDKERKNAHVVPLTEQATPPPPPSATVSTLATTATALGDTALDGTPAPTSKTGAIRKAKPTTPPVASLESAPTQTAKGEAANSPNPSEWSFVPPPSQPLPPATTTPPQLTQISPVGRSKSFQEPGIKLHTSTSGTRSKKKYARFFQRRRSKRAAASKNANLENSKSDYSLDTAASQSIEITIQDEDGNYQPYDEEFHTLAERARAAKRTAQRQRRYTDDDEYEEDDFDLEEDLDDVQTHASSDAGDKIEDIPRPHVHYLSDDAGAGGDISDGGSSRSRSRASASASDNDEHMFQRLLKHVQRFGIGFARKPRYHKRRARSISEEFSSGDTPRLKDEESLGKIESLHVNTAAGCSSSGDSSQHYRLESAASSHKSDKADKDKAKKEKESEEKDIETIKVFDGNNSFRRQLYRVITVPRTYTLEQLLTTSLRAFHITRDPSAFYLTDLYAPPGMEEAPLQDPTPVLSLTHKEGKRPAIYLRFHDRDKGFVRVYPGKLQCSLEEPYVSVPVDNSTVVKDLIRDALDKFGLQDNQIQDYRCSEVLLDQGVTERILSWNERPWEIMKQLGKDSVRQMELMRIYMQHKQDPHGPNIALYVSNLPPGLSERNYDQKLSKYITEENKFIKMGPIYYEYGSMVLTFEDAQKAVRAFYSLREAIIDDKKIMVVLLPNIEPALVPPEVKPLLVFVNAKSGGCQGLELISSFRKLLNPYQVFDLDNGGPLPGLFVFRKIKKYKILVCGGDGTIGWVLQCLDNVGQDSECSEPPCAIVPLGTGNDLARVLCWGSGYNGGEDPLNMLRDVIDAEEIRLDRWTVVFHPDDKPEEPALKAPSSTTGKKKKAHQAHLSQQTNQHHQLPAITSSDIPAGGAQSEDNTAMYVMNNYFGIGIDADLCLDFHNAREENPLKFNSRLHNKGYYVKMGLRKMVNRKAYCKELHKKLRLEVDGKVIDLPPVEGIIILNILSWGSGANPWGPDKDDDFSTPNHYDGMLEIVGVTGVVHLGQIQSGIRTAMRIAQGSHFRCHFFSDMPVQIDGEPWIASPGDVTIIKSALKAVMLKKNKMKMKRRNTEPTMALVGTPTPLLTVALPPAATPDADDNTDTENASNNTDF